MKNVYLSEYGTIDGKTKYRFQNILPYYGVQIFNVKLLISRFMSLTILLCHDRNLILSLQVKVPLYVYRYYMYYVTSDLSSKYSLTL